MAIISQLAETDRTSVLVLLGLSTFFLIRLATRPKDAGPPFAGTWSSDVLSIYIYGCFKFVRYAKSMLDDGYYKFPGAPFRISTPTSTRIILPSKFVKELRSYPDSKLSFSAAIYNVLELKGVGLYYLQEENTPHVKLARSHLTPNLAKLIPQIIDESKHAFQVEIGSVKAWKAVPVYSTIVRIVARISSRIFVGGEICRNEDWIRISVGFTEDVFDNAISMSIFPSFIRPFVAFLLPFQRRVRRQRMESRKLLGPIYEQRLADKAAGKPGVEDAFGWMMANAKPKWQNVNDLVDFHLVLVSLSTVYAMTNALVGILYDLAAHPEYIQPLREEIIQAVTEDNGELKKSTLAKMMKMDSFMKESHRINAALTSFSRKAMQPFDLSDGTHIPAGSLLATSTVSINYDPTYHENPDEFDGYRFYKMRQQADAINKYQFVTSSATEMNFGYGAHACPGRFFAAAEIQLLLVRILMKYDFKYPEGESRPKNIVLGEANLTNTKRSLLMKERVDVPDWDFLQ